MSAQQSSTTLTAAARLACRAWFVALLIFLVWLIITVMSGPPDPAVVGAGKASKHTSETPATDPSGYIVENLPQWGSLAHPALPFDRNAEYVLTGYGVQGFFQTAANKAWTLDYPAPVLTAQLVKRGDSPQIVTDSVKLSWEMDPLTAALPEARGKTGSALAARRGDMVRGPDGLTFTSRVPVTPVQTDGALNPYPVVRITANDAGSGKILAQSAAVLGVSPEFGCDKCHADAEFAILEVHDRHQGTSLQDDARKGSPANCRSCHDGLGADPAKPEAGIGLSVSAAVHGWHTPYMENMGAESCLSCHIGLGRSPMAAGERPRPMFARDLHVQRGLDCVTCHGTLEDHSLALLLAESKAGQSRAQKVLEHIKPRMAAKLDDIAPRLPWSQMPDCAGCHDFNAKPKLATASAFNKWTENPAEHFNERLDGMSALRCPSCHGAPHAVYPAENPVGRDRDNMVPLQYQEHARALGAAGNCALCHMQSMDESAHHPLVNRRTTAVQTPEEIELTLPRVKFSHGSHRTLECSACHHTGYNDDNSLRCTSSGCHDGIQAEKSSDPKYFRNAFHGPGRSCFYCHGNNQKEGKPAGPTACKDCHSAPSPRWAAPAEQPQANPAPVQTPRTENADARGDDPPALQPPSANSVE